MDDKAASGLLGLARLGMEMNDKNDLLTLRREVLGLFEHIQKIRREIASIHRPGQNSDRFSAMSDELDAIVASTESATNGIMEAAENLDAITTAVSAKVEDPEIKAELDKAPDLVGQIFEACSFQDITGQRITKVVTSLQFIESRVHNLISMWGENAIAEAEVDDGESEGEKDEYQQYLNGPQLAGQGVSQADVDAMLNGEMPAPRPEMPPKSKEKAVKPTPKVAVKPAAAPAGAGLDQNDIDKLFD